MTTPQVPSVLIARYKPLPSATLGGFTDGTIQRVFCGYPRCRGMLCTMGQTPPATFGGMGRAVAGWAALVPAGYVQSTPWEWAPGRHAASSRRLEPRRPRRLMLPDFAVEDVTHGTGGELLAWIPMTIEDMLNPKPVPIPPPHRDVRGRVVSRPQTTDLLFDDQALTFTCIRCGRRSVVRLADAEAALIEHKMRKEAKRDRRVASVP